MGGKRLSRGELFSCGGNLPVGLSWRLMMPHKNAASIAPAAPKVCPMLGLVEVHGVWLPNTWAIARLSMLSLWGVPVPCRLIQPISCAVRLAWFNAV